MTELELQDLRQRVKHWRDLTNQLANHRHELDTLKTRQDRPEKYQRLDEAVYKELTMKHQAARDRLAKDLADLGADLAKDEERCLKAETAFANLTKLKAMQALLADARNVLGMTVNRHPIDALDADKTYVTKLRQQLVDWATVEVKKNQETFDKL